MATYFVRCASTCPITSWRSTRRSAKLPKLKSNVKMEGGFMKQLSHWSEANQCEMTFSVFLPTPKSRTAPPPPVSYFGKKTN